MQALPTFNDVQRAHKRIGAFVHHTPVLHNQTINRLVGKEIFFKCENYQKAGAFKFRGATNSILQLSEAEKSKGVATHSSGNHAGALAKAAQIHEVKAHIVMPRNASEIKKKAVAEYGAEIIFCEPTLEARETTLAKVVAETGAHFVHPYDYFHVICGQGTAALELLNDVPNLDMVIAPIGGGGLLSGTSLATKGTAPHIKVFGAEPKMADDAFRSFYAKQFFPSENPQTMADGLLTSLSERTFRIITKHVDEILTTSEEKIVEAMRLVWERMKIIIEPSSAVPLAALLENEISDDIRRIGIIVSGGNVDLGRLPF